jgi:hypothetical protein
MSPHSLPLSTPVEPLAEDTELEAEEEHLRHTPVMLESLEAPPSSRAEAAWAEEVAEQVIGLWEGRPSAVPFDQAVAATQARSAARRR